RVSPVISIGIVRRAGAWSGTQTLRPPLAQLTPSVIRTRFSVPTGVRELMEMNSDVNSPAQLAPGARRRVLRQALIAVQKCGARRQRRPARRGSREESKRAFRRRLRYLVTAGSRRRRRWRSTAEPRPE